jgi:hypothetical protein
MATEVVNQTCLKFEQSSNLAPNKFGHHVNWIEMSIDLAYPQFTFCIYFSDIMILNINVFCPPMKHMILYKSNNTLTVTEQCNTQFISTKLNI